MEEIAGFNFLGILIFAILVAVALVTTILVILYIEGMYQTRRKK